MSSYDSYEVPVQYIDDSDPFNVLGTIKHAEPVPPLKYSFVSDIPLCDQIAGLKKMLKAPHKIDDATLVYYRQSDKESKYLDLESDMGELMRDYNLSFDKDAVIFLRHKLSVRVHTINETLFNAERTTLRQALFSLKRMFQDDADLVMEFVANQGMDALITVARDADATFQQYILKAVGEIVVYVDGMHGLIKCNEMIQWLYQLSTSKFKMVVKAVLDTLLLFVNYTEGGGGGTDGGNGGLKSGRESPQQRTGSPDSSNGFNTAQLLKDAIEAYSDSKGSKPWSLFMTLLSDKSSEAEIQTKTMTLINRTLSNLADMDSYYDIVDSLEDQDMETVMRYHQNRDKNRGLVKEFKAYEESIKQYYTVQYEGEQGAPQRKMRRSRSQSGISSLATTASSNSNTLSPNSRPETPTKKSTSTTDVSPSKSSKFTSEKPPSGKKETSTVKKTGKEETSGVAASGSSSRLSPSSGEGSLSMQRSSSAGTPRNNISSIKKDNDVLSSKSTSSVEPASYLSSFREREMERERRREKEEEERRLEREKREKEREREREEREKERERKRIEWEKEKEERERKRAERQKENELNRLPSPTPSSANRRKLSTPLTLSEKKPQPKYGGFAGFGITYSKPTPKSPSPEIPSRSPDSQPSNDREDKLTSSSQSSASSESRGSAEPETNTSARRMTGSKSASDISPSPPPPPASPSLKQDDTPKSKYGGFSGFGLTYSAGSKSGEAVSTRSTSSSNKTASTSKDTSSDKDTKSQSNGPTTSNTTSTAANGLSTTANGPTTSNRPTTAIANGTTSESPKVMIQPSSPVDTPPGKGDISIKSTAVVESNSEFLNRSRRLRQSDAGINYSTGSSDKDKWRREREEQEKEFEREREEWRRKREEREKERQREREEWERELQREREEREERRKAREREREQEREQEKQREKEREERRRKLREDSENKYSWKDSHKTTGKSSSDDKTTSDTSSIMSRRYKKEDKNTTSLESEERDKVPDTVPLRRKPGTRSALGGEKSLEVFYRRRSRLFDSEEREGEGGNVPVSPSAPSVPPLSPNLKTASSVSAPAVAPVKEPVKQETSKPTAPPPASSPPTVDSKPEKPSVIKPAEKPQELAKIETPAPTVSVLNQVTEKVGGPEATQGRMRVGTTSAHIAEKTKKMMALMNDEESVIEDKKVEVNKIQKKPEPTPVFDELPIAPLAKKLEDNEEYLPELEWAYAPSDIKLRDLIVRDLDFTDLTSDDETGGEEELNTAVPPGGVPPPPPPPGGIPPPPPPPGGVPPPPPPPGGVPPPPPPPGGPPMPPGGPPPPPGLPGKSKKEVKQLRWRKQNIHVPSTKKYGSFWKGLEAVEVPQAKFLELFTQVEQIKKADSGELKKEKFITVLSTTRAQNIQIEVKRLPAARHIRNAILNMDKMFFNKEMIEKLLKLMPTEEERAQIQEKHAERPDLPLGTAEDFLYTLSSVSELGARLSLWKFEYAFQSSEEEIADSLMDLKGAIEEIQTSNTLKLVVGALLSIGNVLNGQKVEAFELDYLSRVNTVKDTVHKTPLMVHLVELVIEQFPESGDLHSQLNRVHRVAKIDWNDQKKTMDNLSADLTNSWKHLRAIARQETSSDSTSMDKKLKSAQSLTDAAERLRVLETIHKRVFNRFEKLLLYMGVNPNQLNKWKIDDFFKLISEFSLEYRTVHGKVLQKIERRKKELARLKTKGKLIARVSSASFDELGNDQRRNSQDISEGLLQVEGGGGGGGGGEKNKVETTDLISVLADQVVKETKKRQMGKRRVAPRKHREDKKTIRRTIGKPEELELLEKFNRSWNDEQNVAAAENGEQ